LAVPIVLGKDEQIAEAVSKADVSFDGMSGVNYNFPSTTVIFTVTS